MSKPIIYENYIITKKHCRFKDITNQKFFRIFILRLLGKDITKIQSKLYYECLCDCGTVFATIGCDIRLGKVKSRGCILKEFLSIQKIAVRYVGQTVNSIKILEDVGKRLGDGRVIKYKCECYCGNIFYSDVRSIKNGLRPSCGCHKNQPFDPTKIPRDNTRVPSKEAKAYSRAVFKRDNFTCQICSKTNNHTTLNAHHLDGWNKFPEKRFDIGNGICLCVPCHKEFHKIYGNGDNTKEQFEEFTLSKGVLV